MTYVLVHFEYIFSSKNDKNEQKSIIFEY